MLFVKVKGLNSTGRKRKNRPICSICFWLQHLLHKIYQQKDALFMNEIVSYCVMTILPFP